MAVDQTVTAQAAAVIEEQQSHLVRLLDAARKAHSDFQTRLRQVERTQRDVAERLVALRETAGRKPSTEHTLEIAALEEQQQSLRRQQVSLSERVALLGANS